MGDPYSMDRRERVAGAIKSEMSRRAAAKHFQISQATAIRWASHADETESPAP